MNADLAKYHLVKLSSRFHGGNDMPEVIVVDLRAGGQKSKCWSSISDTLREHIAETLANNEQVLVFINRRGSASAVSCRDCGQVMKCSNCELPYTLHGFGARARLICHHCGRLDLPLTQCDNCHSVRIFPIGTGTQGVENDLKKMFPAARIARADRDTTYRKEAHDKLYSQMQKHEIDILVGTQMIASGLDLPKVALVGVVLADVGLHRPDFYAPENIFQLITQVAGRAGRREKRGLVVLQTLSPEHYAIRAGVAQDFIQFYNEEIKIRQSAGWPPFNKIIRLEIRSSNKSKAYEDAWQLAEKLRADKNCEILGPSPTLPPKVANKYRFQILIIGENLRTLVSGLELGRDWRIDFG
ncbi:MAG: primosomal protein N' [Patescibacteria group bacterium]|nr:primosomal protein N' [Patescibacteria group bacterium]